MAGGRGVKDATKGKGGRGGFGASGVNALFYGC